LEYHKPVLLEESVSLLNIKPDGVYVDVTFGGGGHSRLILSHLSEKGRLVAFDRDQDAKANLISDSRLVFVPRNFQFIEEALAAREISAVDGIIADLGISSHQIDTAHRGFSFRFDALIDMRMDTTQEVTAADLLNHRKGDELLRIFRTYGEVPNAKKLVRIICERRQLETIRTTHQFESIIERCIPQNKRAKYLAQVYQALRIEVNQELEALRALLLAANPLLSEGGRIVIIAYHSLEDRMVKRFFRAGNFMGVIAKDFYGNPLTPWKLITRKAIQANAEEVQGNSRARSARLRAAEKKAIG